MLSGLSFKKLIITSFSILLCVALALVAPGKSSATTLPVVHESGTLSADETWSAGSVYMIDSTVTVPSGITLTIDHGAIVKYASLFSGNITVSGGTLDVTGTSADSVTFTSANDDSAGGDSTNNGATNGTAGDYSSAVDQESGVVNVAHATFEYGQRAFTGNSAGSVPDDGALTLTDSFITNVSEVGIYHAGAATLERNTFNVGQPSWGAAIQLDNVYDLGNVPLSGNDENTFSGVSDGAHVVGLNGHVPATSILTIDASSGALVKAVNVDVSGVMNLSSGVTYVSGYNGISINGGGTVNIPAGAIYKTSNAYYHSNNGFTLDGGTLNVNGTAANPVVFTSSEDDSVGGDTTGDGSTTGSSSDYSSAILQQAGTVNVAHASFKYAYNPIAGYFPGSNPDDGPLTVTDSSFTNVGWTAISHAGEISLERNTFDLQSASGDMALRLLDVPDLTGVSLSGIDKNVFNGTRPGAIAVVINGTIPAEGTLTVDSSTGVLVEPQGINVLGTLNLSDGVTYAIGGGCVTVSAGGTLSVPAGAIYKTSNQYYHSYIGITVDGGTLNVAGTAASPVTFTSSEDDSAGGDTTGDGSTTGNSGDYSSAIYQQSGTVNVAHALFDYASNPISGDSAGGAPDDGPLTVTDSLFVNVGWNGVFHAGAIFLERNTFDLQSAGGDYAVGLLDTPDLSGVSLSGIDKNTFDGSRKGAVAVSASGTIPSGSTLTVDASSRALFEPKGVDVSGTLNLSNEVTYTTGNGGTAVESGGVINIPAGATYKVDNGHYHSNTGVTVNGGTLNVNGTSTSPVTFTSSEDDSVAGDTTQDGASTGATGDYLAVISQTDGTVNVSHTSFKYAQQPLSIAAGSLTVSDSSISGVGADLYQTGGSTNISNTTISDAANAIYAYGGALIVRGSFNNISGRYITACNWNASCAVDAAYTDWGNTDGPLNTNPANNLVCGSVTVAPWIHGGSTYTQTSNPNLYSVRNCDNSSTPDTAMSSAITNFQQGISNREIDCSGGYQAACDAIDSAYACLSGAMNVAQSTTPWPLPGSSTADDVNAFGGLMLSGAANYMTSQEVVSPLGSGLDFFNQLASVAGTLVTMANAYNSCAP